MSLAAYLASHDHSIVKAALNVADGIVVTVILASLLIEQRGGKILFTRNEQPCLVISCITMARLGDHEDCVDWFRGIPGGHVGRLFPHD